MTTATVKIMRSYDYCHFEVSLTSDDLQDGARSVNDLRIECAKLVDRAVEDYQKMKSVLSHRANTEYERKQLSKRVQAIKENFPQSEWTPEQKAEVKLLDDMNFEAQWSYEHEY